MILVPVFAGRDHNEELYILYQEDENYLTRPFVMGPPREVTPPTTYHLRLPDGEIHALPPGSQLNVWDDPEKDFKHLKIISGVWTGELNGSKQDLMVAKIVDRNRDNV
jgi:hypothetical protein